MTTTDCPPLAGRVTKSLLGYGVIAGPIYVVAVAAQAATRDGFDPTRHAASQLANGELGWIQIATFLVTGAMTIAAAVGVRRALGPGRQSAWASGLLGGLWCRAGGCRVLQSRSVRRFPARHPGRRGRGQLARVGPFRGRGPRVRLPGRRVLRAGVVVRAQRTSVVGLVLTHHGFRFRGQFHRPVVRIGRRRHDSGVHRCGRAGVGLALRGVGQALPAVGSEG